MLLLFFVAASSFHLLNALPFTGSYVSVDGNSGWQYVLSFQDPDGIGSNVNLGQAAFNQLFAQSAEHILLVQIFNFNNPIKEFVYMKRYTCTNGELDVYSLTSYWTSSIGSCGNTMHVDYDLYETLADALAGTNEWQYCNYNDPGVGMFRDCGRTGFTGSWNMAGNGQRLGPKPAKFFIYAPEQQLRSCATWGATLSSPHKCECRRQGCGSRYCNNAGFVADRLGVSLTTTQEAALCTSSTLDCCCSCPNCASYIAY